MTAPTTRTDGIDFAAVLHAEDAEGVGWPDLHVEFERLLAAKVPELCPDCKGELVVFCADDDDIGDACDHPNAPTIGQMLREHQALTALAEYAQHDDMCGASQAYGPITCDCGLDAARAALEAVRGD